MTQRLTNQLNDMLFPTVVDNDTAGAARPAADASSSRARVCRSRPSCRCGGATDADGATADPRVGRIRISPAASIVLQLLALVVIVRVGNATAARCSRARAASPRRVREHCRGRSSTSALEHRAGPAARPGRRRARHARAGRASPRCFVLFPAGCRRVELSVLAARRRGRLAGGMAGSGDGGLSWSDRIARARTRSSRSAREMVVGRRWCTRRHVRVLRPQPARTRVRTVGQGRPRCSSRRSGCAPVSEGHESRHPRRGARRPTAGRHRRRPKCLARVGGGTLLERQIDSLRTLRHRRASPSSPDIARRRGAAAAGPGVDYRRTTRDTPRPTACIRSGSRAICCATGSSC